MANPKTEAAQAVLNGLKEIVVSADLDIIQAAVPLLKAEVTQAEQDEFGKRVHEIIRGAVLDTARHIMDAAEKYLEKKE